MIILAIDPGLQHTGWAVLSNSPALIHVASGVIHTKAKETLENRLHQIMQDLQKVIAHWHPTSAAIEDTYVNINNASSLLLAHARAAALIACASCNLAVTAYPAKTVKKSIIGNAKADKAQMRNMLGLLLPNVNITTDDQADAIALAICHINYHRFS